ncbi:MAG TPA: hypothetical protein VF245_01975 [Solirubrobacterales bacterium]
MADAPELPPDSLERYVLDTIKGAFKSREVLEAERPDDVPPFDDDRAMLQNWATLIGRQGRLIAHLSVVPETRTELLERMPDMLNRAPAWMNAHMEGVEEMTLKLFMQGIAQTMAEHRKAIERVVEEQVAEPDEIEEALAGAPVPAASDEEDRSDLMQGVGLAMTAHTKALVDIAYDLERQVRSFLKAGIEQIEEDEEDEEDWDEEGEEWDEDEDDEDWDD